MFLHPCFRPIFTTFNLKIGIHLANYWGIVLFVKQWLDYFFILAQSTNVTWESIKWCRDWGVMSTKTSRGHLSSKPDIDILRLIDIYVTLENGTRWELFLRLRVSKLYHKMRLSLFIIPCFGSGESLTYVYNMYKMNTVVHQYVSLLCNMRCVTICFSF